MNGIKHNFISNHLQFGKKAVKSWNAKMLLLWTKLN